MAGIAERIPGTSGRTKNDRAKQIRATPQIGDAKAAAAAVAKIASVSIDRDFACRLALSGT
jgi:hypothetical protein